VRVGLLDGRHRAAMGEALWLYEYLHSIVQFTGERAGETFPGHPYTHAAAAAALGANERTIRWHFMVLRRRGYITATRRRTGYDVAITNCARAGAAESAAGNGRCPPEPAVAAAGCGR
jgi:hypothetical protein